MRVCGAYVNRQTSKDQPMKLSLTSAAAFALVAGACTAHAATPLGEYFNASGFGTLGAVTTNSGDGQYVREQQVKGATRRASLLVDSNLGLQLTGKANDWLSGTVQALTAQRTTDDLTTRIEWAFVKVAPIEGLALRAGKMSLPNFLISDSRRIGFANTALRPSNEVYGLDLLNGGLTGGDVSYRLPVLGNSLTVTGLLGNSKGISDITVDVKKLRGINTVWDGNWYTLRAGYIQAEPQLKVLLGTSLPPDADIAGEAYKFTGIGFTIDRADVVLQGEYVKRHSTKFASYLDADAWYLMGGYRMNKLLPYLQYSERKAKNGSVVAPQKTAALGLRWDAFSAAALKFQLEHVDTQGTAGASFITPTAMTRPVTTLSAALDFVF
jgi:hypothetical protein